MKLPHVRVRVLFGAAAFAGLIALLLPDAYSTDLTLPFFDSLETAQSLDLKRLTAQHSPAQQAVLLAFKNRWYGSLASPAGSDVGTDTFRTFALAVADLDGDGDLDVIAGNENAPNRVYLNNGTADPFNGVAGSDLTADAGATHALAVADLDADGDLDVVAGNVGQRNRVYLNNGTAEPFGGVAGSDLTADTHDTNALVIADLDGDGDLDVVTGNANQPNRVYLNNGTANPFSGISGVDLTADAHATRALTAADLDNDGDLDIVAGNDGQPGRVYLNNGTANPFNGVTGADLTADAYSTRALGAADLDGDGDVDIVTGNNGQANRIYLNNGTASPFDGVSGVDLTADAYATSALALADVDADGDFDVVAGNTDAGHGLRLYLNNGTPDPFNGATGVDLTADALATSAVGLADLDGDGDLDLVLGNDGQPSRVYANQAVDDPFYGVTPVDLTAEQFYDTRAMAVGDLDGDGDLDLVMKSRYATSKLFLNNGTADPFNGVTSIDLINDYDSNVMAIALGDLDADGDLDIVLGNAGEPSRILFNNGTADPFNGVTASLLSTDSFNLRAVTVGDFDRDGDLDILTGSIGAPPRIFMNNGTADPFGGVTGTNLSEDVQDSYALAVADLDGDGDLDVIAVVTVLDQPVTLRYYLNNGTADPFNGVAGIDLSAELGYPQGLGAADIDADGDVDLIVPSRVYLNNGTAMPFNGVVGTELQGHFDGFHRVAVADFDRDGRLDILLATGNALPHIFWNNGTTDPFAAARHSEIFTSANQLAVGDLDSDGDIDFIGARDEDQLPLLLNGRSPEPYVAFADEPVAPAADQTNALVLADLNADGALDVVTANDGETNRVYWGKGPAAPFTGVTVSELTADAHRTFALAVADFDADADLDVVAGNVDQPNRVYLNNGTADPFADVAGADLTADAAATKALIAADLDGDGDLDVVAGNDGQPNRVYLNNGSAAPFDAITGRDLTADLHATRALAVADFDRDGDLDVVAGNVDQPNRLYLNNGTADPFAGVVGSDISADAHATRALAIADLDGDGDLDLIAGNDQQPNRVYLNNGTADPFGGVTGTDLSADAHATRALAVADLDGDGDVDVVAGNENQPSRVYRNNGTAAPFSGVTGLDLSAVAHATRALAVADLDCEGTVDVVAGNFGQPNVLYRRIRYQTAAQTAVSTIHALSDYLPSGPGRPLYFTADAELPANTGIDYYVSNSGGQYWHKVTHPATVQFAQVGNEVQWRAELWSRSPVKTPILRSISLRYAPALAQPSLASEAVGGLSLLEAADGTVVTLLLSASNVLAGDQVTLYWGPAATMATVSAADLQSGGVALVVSSALIASAGEGAFPVTAAVSDAYHFFGASPAVTATVDFTAPGAPGAPQLAAEAADGVLDAFEVLDGTQVTVKLAGTGVQAGDTVSVVWDGTPVVHVLGAAEIAAGAAVVVVPAGVIGRLALREVAIYAVAGDMAGNVSPHSAAVRATVSTDGADQDGDGLGDSDEVLLGSNPANGDSDGDGLADGLEAALSSDPNANDSDGDGLLDGWEYENGTNLLEADADNDADGDGLTNAQEQTLGTDPASADSDNDGLPDAYETEIGSDPRVADSDQDIDGDGVTNRDAFYAGAISAVARPASAHDSTGCGCRTAGGGNLESGLLVAFVLLRLRLRRWRMPTAYS